MTVLRRVKTLGRSYRQSLWRCGVASERYLGYPNTAAWNSPLLSIRSFSTSSNSDDLRPAVIGGGSTVPQVLEVASSEARQVISKAPKSSNKASTTSSSSPKEAMEAAQAMMALTSPTKPLAEAILENKAKAEQVACLHQALIAVTSWCISLVPMDAALLLKSALDLARRAQDLSLPLHLPLYKSLATAIAQHSQDEHDVVDAILETANLAVSAFSVPLSSSFFSGSLLSLVEKGCPRQAINLRKAMKERHDIEDIDIRTAMELMQAVNRRFDAHIDDPSSSTLDDDAAYSELFDMLRKPLLTSTDPSETDEQTLAYVLRNWDELYTTFGDTDETDSDYSDGDEEEDDDNQVESMTQMMDELETIEDDIAECLEDLDRINKARQSSAGSLRRTLQDIKESSDDEESDDITKQMVYLRDSSSWMLPDVTLQLVQLNSGRDVFYTSQYEQEILREMIRNRGDY